MPGDEFQQQIGELRSMMINMTRDIGEIKGEFRVLSDVKRVAEEAAIMARKAEQSAQAAHHRLDKTDKVIFWVGTTFVGAILIAVASFIAKGGLASG